MVAGVLPSPATLLLLTAITLLLWFTTTTTTTITAIFNRQPPTSVDKIHIQQQDHHHHHLPYPPARRTLHTNKAILPPAATQFNFSPFIYGRHHHRKTHHSPFVPRSKIDPRYGVETHLVPTGPNPLHH
ncbi:hypothetical protein L6452_39402 [Arctium lappa]|uniref:Uncharacterized protein n=1 Tax=Arctium lappa TaxID=4217 RepID=A0ACB8XS61_ARCLA|nr:hypothetical protein L6452_39402 [Arctium lappa]